MSEDPLARAQAETALVEVAVLKAAVAALLARTGSEARAEISREVERFIAGISDDGNRRGAEGAWRLLLSRLPPA